jgi:CheY-like chemotaxis protein
LADARVVLTAGIFDACLFLPRSLDRETLAEIAATRALGTQLPLAVVLPVGTATDQQQRVLAAGADLTLFHPISVPDLAGVLQRFGARSAAAIPVPPAALAPAAAPGPKSAAMSTALEVLRDFSQVLGYSLDYRQLTQHFIQKLREVVGLSRIAIFLEPGTIGALPRPPRRTTRASPASPPSACRPNSSSALRCRARAGWAGS